MRTLICVLFCALVATAQVKLTRAGDRVDVTVEGRPFTSFHFSADKPKVFLHPLVSFSGKTVTRGFPIVTDVPGESKDHPHHRGIFFAQDDVNGAHLWNEPAGHGRIVLKELGEIKSGKDSGSLTATMLWKTADGKDLLEERRVMTFRKDAIDFVLTLKPAGTETIKLGDTKEGFFAVRLTKPLEEKSAKCALCTGVMVNSEGATGEKSIWGKRATWVDYSGTVDGENIGIAMFDHPSNPRHPSHWHARAYGLFAVNPFGERDFYNDKTRDGSMSLEPGKSVTFHYRIWLHTGNAQESGVAEQYKKWASTR